MKIAVVFPGYGSQYVGMAKELYDESRVIQEYFEEASNCLNINFVRLCFASSDAEINRLEHALVAHVLVSASLYAYVKEQEGMVPDMVAGYTSGEWSALLAAGGMSFPDLLYLITKYVSFYQELLATMPVVGFDVKGIDRDMLREIMRPYHGDVSISVYRSLDEHVVVSRAAHEGVLQELFSKHEKAKIVNLSAIEGLHSSWMQPVVDQLMLQATKVDFKDLALPLMMSSENRVIATKDEVRDLFFKSMVSPLYWDAVQENVLKADLIIEMGPGTYLRDMLKKQYPDKMVLCVNHKEDMRMLHATLEKMAKKDVAEQSDAEEKRS